MANEGGILSRRFYHGPTILNQHAYLCILRNLYTHMAYLHDRLSHAIVILAHGNELSGENSRLRFADLLHFYASLLNHIMNHILLIV